MPKIPAGHESQCLSPSASSLLPALLIAHIGRQSGTLCPLTAEAIPQLEVSVWGYCVGTALSASLEGAGLQTVGVDW